MCVSFAPAEFTGAIAFGGEVDKHTHLLGYENKAQSFVGPNCMLLHVPTDELTADSLIPTQHAPGFMKSLGSTVSSLRPARRSMTRGGAVLRGATFVQYGAYDVLLANSAADIPAALDQVSPAKRPALNDALLHWYDQNFDGYSFILACFNNAIETVNHPILVQYDPWDSSTLFVPGLESHSGSAPALGMRDHDRDFKVVFGSRHAGDYNYPRAVRYSDNLGELANLLPEYAVGFRDENYGTNSDYVAGVEDVRSGLNGQDLFKTMSQHFSGSPLERYSR